MTVRPVDFADALADPTAYFERPRDVTFSPGLSRKQKIEILTRWEADARELMVAADENMGGGEPNRLDEIRKALAFMGGPDSELGATTMHGHKPG